jgi:hypothetical protein
VVVLLLLCFHIKLKNKKLRANDKSTDQDENENRGLFLSLHTPVHPAQAAHALRATWHATLYVMGNNAGTDNKDATDVTCFLANPHPA